MTGFYYVTNQVFEMVVDSSISIISLYPIPSVQEIADNYKKPPITGGHDSSKKNGHSMILILV
ncbi:hypothetical protein [Streptococcus suis]|uniref:hypothetical protein n=1 Tax=Streptococcus suis TaxID=1307 RepID=UPI0009A3478E|nr:hypothetical protein [Streptococcus suis]NQH73646.1 hypothetical protein [Streptococcus suis]